jgi:predicted ribosome quality control (RQC) complex YloA/Tae2 family protein
MRRKALSVLVLAAMEIPAHGTLIVHDPGVAIQQSVNHAMDYVQMVKTQIDGAATQLNTLRSYENTVVQLARMGNAAELKNLPGVSDVAQLAGSGLQLYRELGSFQNYLIPAHYQADLNSILTSYSQPNWQGFVTSSGASVSPTQSAFQFPVASWNTSNQALDLINRLQQQRQTLQQQRAQTQSFLAGATTDAEVKKYSGNLAALNAAIAEVDQQVHQVLGATQLQQQKIVAGQQVTQAATAEREAAAQYRAIDQEFEALPVADLHRPVNW